MNRRRRRFDAKGDRVTKPSFFQSHFQTREHLPQFGVLSGVFYEDHDFAVLAPNVLDVCDVEPDVDRLGSRTKGSRNATNVKKLLTERFRHASVKTDLRKGARIGACDADVVKHRNQRQAAKQTNKQTQTVCA